VKTLTVKLPDALLAEIDPVALNGMCPARRSSGKDSQRTPKGGMRSLWDRMEDLVIRDESLPADLSSKKEHLRYVT
jgi:hypothetical protein